MDLSLNLLGGVEDDFEFRQKGYVPNGVYCFLGLEFKRQQEPHKTQPTTSSQHPRLTTMFK